MKIKYPKQGVKFTTRVLRAQYPNVDKQTIAVQVRKDTQNGRIERLETTERVGGQGRPLFQYQSLLSDTEGQTEGQAVAQTEAQTEAQAEAANT